MNFIRLRSIRKTSTKTIKLAGIVIISIILFVILLPEIFPGYVSKKIKTWANHSIESQFNFSGSRLSFIKHFPSLTLTLYDFSLNGAKPFSNDTLIAGREISFGISFFSLFQSKLIVNKFFLDEARINIQVDKEGNANYNIYKSPGNKTAAENNASLEISSISINHSKLVYADHSLPLLVTAGNLTYQGDADLSKAMFDLQSKINIESLNVMYNNQSYVLDKKIDATLITAVNTHSLAFTFQKNDIKINELPLSIKGTLDILKNGYGVDMHVESGTTPLSSLLSVLPPSFIGWYAKTEIRGDAQLNASFKGNYFAATNTQPTLSFGIKVHNGYINHNRAAEGVSNIQLDFETIIPGLKPDSIIVKLDTFRLNLGKDFMYSKLYTSGINPMNVRCSAGADIDVGQLTSVLGIDLFTIKGRTSSQMTMDGIFKINYDKASRQSHITSLPVYNIRSSWSNGYFKMAAVPYTINNISLAIQSHCTKQNSGLSAVEVNLTPLSFNLAGKPFTLNAILTNFDDLHYNIQSKGTLDLEKLYAAFAQKDLDVKGYIATDLSLKGIQSDATNGRYDRLKNSGTLFMKDISLHYFPYPKSFLVKQGLLRFKQDKIWLQNFETKYSENELLLNGFVENLINYAIKNEALKGNVELRSSLFAVNDFMNNLALDSTTTASDTSTASGVVLLPANISMHIKAVVKNVLYNEMNVQHFTGHLLIDKGNVQLDNTSFKIADAIFSLKASYAPINTNAAKFGISIKADSFDVKKAYNQIKMFRELASAAEKTEGLISLNYQLDGMLDHHMTPVYPSLKGAGVLDLENVKVYGLKLFNAVSKATGRDSINNPNLSKVSIKTSIANNIINIERTRMKVFGFRPRIEGQTSFDGRLNLKFRLGLPPFGIIGIPMTVRGTSDKPVVKLRRGKDGYALEEAEVVGPEE